MKRLKDRNSIKNAIKYSKISKRVLFFTRKSKVFLKFYAKYFVRSILGRYKQCGEHQLPNTIQLPITYKCNYNCVMCGMRKLVSQKGFSSVELQKILSDPLFKKIVTVGVNGGEPFILPDINEYIRIIIETLPNLKNIFMISNGYFTDAILEKSEIIHNLCKLHGIRYNLSISLDGVGDMQNKMRGHKNAFVTTSKTIEKILKDPRKYCDSFGAICTITKINVYNIAELDTWAKMHNIPMSYNIATIHKRISNEDRYNDFSVFTDKRAQLMAAEFFYSKFLENFSEQYFARYFVVKYNKRIAMCGHQRQVVTLTPNGAISYCATHSKEIGNAYERSAYSIFFDPENLKYREGLRKTHCVSCSHYSDALTAYNYMHTYKDELRALMEFYI